VWNLEWNHESFSQGTGSTSLKSNTLLRRPFWIRQCPSPLMLRLLILHMVVFVHLKMGLFFISSFRVSEWEHKPLWLKENTFKLCIEVYFLQRIFFPSRNVFNSVRFSDDNTTVSIGVTFAVRHFESFSSVEILFASATPVLDLYVHIP